MFLLFDGKWICSRACVFVVLGGPCIMFEGKSWTAETKAKLEDLTIPISTWRHKGQASTTKQFMSPGVYTTSTSYQNRMYEAHSVQPI